MRPRLLLLPALALSLLSTCTGTPDSAVTAATGLRAPGDADGQDAVDATDIAATPDATQVPEAAEGAPP
ncbi:MAG TPA: hypothetical protein VM324_00230, partial [Egibacteraceae bacterium]|nr:hypothetical protein [Egibacteraceae bacterium]